MRGRSLILGLSGLLAILSWLLVAPASFSLHSLAQTLGTPAATPPNVASLIAPYPAGVSLTALATRQLVAPAANPATMRLERWSLGPGDTLAGALPAVRLIVVENGELTVTRDDGGAARYPTGASVLIAADDPVTLTSDGATPAVWVQGTLGPDASPPTGASPTTLLTGDTRLPRGDVTIALVRFTVSPDAGSGPRVFTGPVGFAVESGSLTVAELSGPPTQIERGGGLIAPAFTQHDISNAGPVPVAGIAFAVFPVSPALAGAPAATATPAVDVAATSTVSALIADNATREAHAASAVDQAATGVAAANATVVSAERTSLGLSTELGTMTARAFTADATLASLEPTAAAARAAIDASASSETAALATAAAYATVVTEAQATGARLSATATAAASEIAALRESAAASEATIAARSALFAESAATGTVVAAAASVRESTITADLAAATGNQANLAAAEATRSAELAAAQSVVGTQAAQLTAVAVATAPGISASSRQVLIQGDVSGVVIGDEAARGAIVSTLREELAAEIRNGCTAGLVLTFGYASEVNAGTGIAEAVNALIQAEIPELFAGADTLDLAQIEQPFGAVELRIYLVNDCAAPANAVVVTTPVQPTIQPTQ